MASTRKKPAPAVVEDEFEDDDEFAEFDAAGGDGGDKLSLDPRVLADAAERGVVIQWKRLSVLGKPDDTYYAYLLQRRWTPIPAGRYPYMVLPGTAEDQAIVREGQVLMERPLKFQRRAEEQQRQEARQQVVDKEAQLYESPDGTMERTAINVRKGYAPVDGVRVAGRGGKEVEIAD